MEQGAKGGIKLEFMKILSRLYGDRFSEDEDVLKVYWRDYWPFAVMKDFLGKPYNKPLGVIWPESPEEIACILKLAKKYGFKVVPYGGGSGVNGAALGEKSIVLDMKRMNDILSLNEDNLTVTVESGVYVKELENYLNRRNYTLRHIPQSFPEAVIGGLISTFSTGQYSTKYGGIEDMVLNLEIVTPSGDITWLRKNTVPRSAAGPDLKMLFIGAEGQLGIITKAVLKIRPQPKYIWKNAFVFDDFIEANYVIKKLLKNNIIPAIVRIYDREDSLIRFSIEGNVLLIVMEEYLEGFFNTVVKTISSLFSKEKCVDAGPKYVDKWFEKRFDAISELTKYLLPMGLWFDTVETGVMWSSLPHLYNNFKNNLLDIDGVVSILTHSSHFYLNGVCLYFTIAFRQNEKLYWMIWDKAMTTVLENGGTITHHHGVGRLRSKWIHKELLGGYPILRRIKEAIDTNRLLSSGGWL